MRDDTIYIVTKAPLSMKARAKKKKSGFNFQASYDELPSATASVSGGYVIIGGGCNNTTTSNYATISGS